MPRGVDGQIARPARPKGGGAAAARQPFVAAVLALAVACALSFAHPKDKRPVFVFPWQGMTVIGTTDLDHKDDLNTEASISSAEMTHLLEAVNSALPDAHLRREGYWASMAGVRPVVAGSSKDPSKESANTPFGMTAAC